VEAEAPDHVILEITNLLGSREATIQVNQGAYTIDVPDKQGGGARRTSGLGSWGGIPLRWASELFLGRIPCPSKSKELRLEVSEAGELIAVDSTRQERFVYRFRQWAGRAWPESLHWEQMARTGPSMASVDFKFDDPDDKTGTPKKWEAKSSRGEVKLRWRDLEISP
jgi:hypothetical protein